MTGRCGNTRIQSLPERLTHRVIAIRPASIWRAVTRPFSRAWRAKSPKETSEPRRAMPALDPFCILRNLVRFGESMNHLGASGGGADTRATATALKHLALEDPDLDADDAVLRTTFGEAELNVGAERVKRNAPLTVGLHT